MTKTSHQQTDNIDQNNHNVDENEIEKFAALASRWWDQSSEFKPLHEINPLRLDFISQRAPLKGMQVLDVGCGGGILSESMANQGAIVTGIDMGEAPLKVAELHALESAVDVTYQKISVEQMAQEHPQSFDVVTCMEMLEHVPNPASVIKACSKLLKPGGSVFFSTINRNPKSYLLAIIGAEYVLNLLPKGTHEYNKFIRPSELSSWLRQSQLELHKLIGMSYNPLSKQYSLGQDLDVNYIAYATKE